MIFSISTILPGKRASAFTKPFPSVSHFQPAFVISFSLPAFPLIQIAIKHLA
jgi:hypothetical protein